MTESAYALTYLVIGLVLALVCDPWSRYPILRLLIWPVQIVYALVWYPLGRAVTQMQNTYYCFMSARAGRAADERMWRLCWKLHPRRMRLFCRLLNEGTAHAEV